LSHFGYLWKRLLPAYSASSEARASPIYASILHGYRGIKPQSIQLQCEHLSFVVSTVDAIKREYYK